MVNLGTSVQPETPPAQPTETPTAAPLTVRAAHVISEVFQPPLVVAALLLVSPLNDPGFPGTMWYGLLALAFVCGLPFAAVLALVRLGKLTDHHISNRKQRFPVLMMTACSVAAGLLVLIATGAPHGVIAMVLAVVGGIIVLAAVSLFWKMSGHASAIACSAVIGVLMLGPSGLALLLLIPVIGWSRLVLQAHSLGQVVAGSMFGGIVMAGAWWLLRNWLI